MARKVTYWISTGIIAALIHMVVADRSKDELVEAPV